MITIFIPTGSYKYFFEKDLIKEGKNIKSLQTSQIYVILNSILLKIQKIYLLGKKKAKNFILQDNYLRR